MLAQVRETLAEGLPKRVTVVGEVSNFKRHQSGHCYFTLKDENAVLPCVMFKSAFSKLKFKPEDGMVRAVDDVSWSIVRGETMALVGESGCGKSVTALSIMRLITQPPGRIASGHILLEGNDLLTLSEPAMRDIRGNRIAMVFQEP